MAIAQGVRQHRSASPSRFSLGRVASLTPPGTTQVGMDLLAAKDLDDGLTDLAQPDAVLGQAPGPPA